MKEDTGFPAWGCWEVGGGFWVRGLVVGPLATNCYVLGRGDEVLIIDPGADPEAIIGVTRTSRSKVKYILATHAHFDHVGAMRILQEGVGGECLLHRQDLPLMENISVQAASFGMKVGPPAVIDRFVEEGDAITLGDDGQRLLVLHTPGHSPGGISLLGPGFVFVGDTLFAGSIGRTDLPGSSYSILMDSIRRKLLVLGDDILVFPGHGEPSSIGIERETNPFLRGEMEI